MTNEGDVTAFVFQPCEKVEGLFFESTKNGEKGKVDDDDVEIFLGQVGGLKWLYFARFFKLFHPKLL